MNPNDPDETSEHPSEATPTTSNTAGSGELETRTVRAHPLAERYFGRYSVESELGRGGMGVVLLARDEELNKQVALKLLPIEVACDVEAIASLKKEVLRGMSLLHPGIVRVFNFERDARGVAIVMEYVAGQTLTDKRRRESGECFDCDDILSWVEELCAILDYAHTEAQIAHRDLKPRNIIVTLDGHVKVADFGLAAGLSGSLSRISLQGEASGTPPYMSPQQVRGETPTHFDDIYALGATIYELLTGKAPFYRGNVLAQVLQATPPSMEQRRAERGIGGKAPIPPAWEHAIAACLAKDPAARPPSAKALSEWIHDANAIPKVDRTVRIVRPTRSTASPGSAIPANRSQPRPPGAFGSSASASHTEARPAPAQAHQPQKRRRKDRGELQSTILGWLKQTALTLVAAAIAAGGAHALRHRILSSAGTTKPTPRQEPTVVPRKSSIESSTPLTPVQIESRRLDDRR